MTNDTYSGNPYGPSGGQGAPAPTDAAPAPSAPRASQTQALPANAAPAYGAASPKPAAAQGGAQPSGAAAYAPASAAPQPEYASGRGWESYAYQVPEPTPYQVQQQQQKKNSRWWIPVVVVLALLLLLAASLASCAASLSSLGFVGSTAAQMGFEDDTVAVISIDGTIQYDGTANSPEGLQALLEQAADDDNIKAVVLRVDSGGGVATAGEEMTNLVRDFEKPIVVSSGSINASAAYMISSQANRIFVAKTTEIGSIGVVMQTTDLSGLMEKLGISIDNITSADSKDSSYGTRPLTEEERAYYQDMVDKINTLFIEWVAEGRDMTVEQVRPLATGMVFLGIDAIDNGLADEIGSLDDACRYAAELAGCEDTYVVDSLTLSSYDLDTLLGFLGQSREGESASIAQLEAAIRELESHGSIVR